MHRTSIVCVLLLFVSCVLSYELRFLNTPTTVRLPATGSLSSTDVSTVISNLLGLSAEKAPGFSPTSDILHRPAAAALFIVDLDDANSLTPSTQNTFQLSNNERLNAIDTSNLEEDVEQHFIERDSTIIKMINKNIIVAYGASSFDANSVVQLPVNTIRSDVLNSELANMERLNQWFAKMTGLKPQHGVPDLYILRIHALAHKFESEAQRNQATALIEQAIAKLTDELKRVYDNNILIGLATQSAQATHTDTPRQKRMIEKRAAANDQMPTTDYKFARDDYPAMFAIILFISVGFAVLIIFIAVGMWTMEPGKDTIIYRVTQARAKKDM